MIRAATRRHGQQPTKNLYQYYCRKFIVLIPATILLLEHVYRMLLWPSRDNASYFSGPKEGDDSLGALFPLRSEKRTLYNILPLPILTRVAADVENRNHPCPANSAFKLNIERIILPPSRNVTKIPRIIHQTSKSRCLTKKITKATLKWFLYFDDSSEGDNYWSYYLHDDAAVQRLLLQNFAEFPHLEQVARQCLLYGTASADLWRYLVLWEYGGVYADLDAVPTKNLNVNALLNADAFFVVEQYHLLSQWFMAVSPRHPLMFYAVQTSLAKLLQAPDTGRINAAFVTGPHALHEAFRYFRRDAGIHVDPATGNNKPVRAGHFLGTQNRSVTVVGKAEEQNEYVRRDVLGALKRNEYRKMGIRHFQDDMEAHTSNKSCIQSLYGLYSAKT